MLKRLIFNEVGSGIIEAVDSLLSRIPCAVQLMYFEAVLCSNQKLTQNLISFSAYFSIQFEYNHYISSVWLKNIKFLNFSPLYERS